MQEIKIGDRVRVIEPGGLGVDINSVGRVTSIDGAFVRIEMENGRTIPLHRSRIDTVTPDLEIVTLTAKSSPDFVNIDITPEQWFRLAELLRNDEQLQIAFDEALDRYMGEVFSEYYE